MSEKVNKPKDTDFIELEKSDFKKKSNFLKSSLKYMIIFFIFFSVGFYSQDFLKKKYFSDTRNIEGSSESMTEGFINENIEKKNEELTQIDELVNLNKKMILNIEKKYNSLNTNLKNLDQVVEELRYFNPKNDFLKDYRKITILVSFMILKENFLERKSFGDEISKIANLFPNDFYLQKNLGFLETLDLENLKNNNYLLQQLNLKIDSYDNDLDDLFDKIEKHSITDSENIFKSKEEFLNYIKEIFKATFKVTKYEDQEYLIGNKNPENIKKILLSAKEFLLLDNLNESISILEDSEINNSQFEEWLFEANKIKQANSNFSELEQQILQLLGKSFD